MDEAVDAPMPHGFYSSNAFQPFLREFANWNGLTTISISFDIDFVPDFILAHLLDLLEPTGVRATFFVTHPTPLLRRIHENRRWEAAIHPYADPKSTQGNGLAEIVGNLLAVTPGAIGSRFHLLQRSYRDLALLSTLGIRYDASNLQMNTPYLVPSWHPDLNLVTIPYHWEDGSWEGSGYPMQLSQIDLSSPGIKSVSFHPLNIYLNQPDQSARKTLMNKVGRISDCTPETIGPYRGSGDGSERVLKDLLTLITQQGVRTVSLGEVFSAFTESAGIATSPKGERRC